ncbi:MAG: sulfide/dihydroorotate dehydrogenase-like FAD/NAD-binding protein [Firmicutes bacterium]|nr:sulfide/dihydroorotate dehydrogenase-like FAD/NAD-binding protein [Bacillota bacterium]
MYTILRKDNVAPNVDRYVIAAPDVAAKAQPGQFVVLRLHEQGERIPISISDWNRDAGTITLIVQVVGHTTQQMAAMEIGDSILDLLGPLGKPAVIEPMGTIACVAGGVATAIIYPEARQHRKVGNRVLTLVGVRNQDHLFYQEELAAISDRVLVATDDGSYGHKGFVTDLLQQVIDDGIHLDQVIAIGPIPMMQAVAELTKRYEIKTVVSLNPIMMDGTGMCGACRVRVGDEIKFCCTDGPEFDGHLVDFTSLLRRSRLYERLEYEASLPVKEREGKGCDGRCHE